MLYRAEVVTLFVVQVSYSYYTSVVQINAQLYEQDYKKPEFSKSSNRLVLVNDII